jgi:hypothetical protein
MLIQKLLLLLLLLTVLIAHHLRLLAGTGDGL